MGAVPGERPSPGRALPGRLLVVTDRRQAVLPLVEAAAAALAGGARWLSLREKDLPEAELLDLASHIRALGRERGAAVTLHGPAALAARAELDGVHLPSGGDPAGARALLGPAALVGVSAHSPDEAGAALRAGADYVILGPVFETASKPGYGPALGLRGLAGAVRGLPGPVVAIGGIGPANAGACIEAGAAAVAVMGGVMRAADPAAAVRALLRPLPG